MKNRLKHSLVAALLLFVFLALPVSHHHASLLYDANCFAGKVEVNLISYSFLFLALIIFLFYSFQLSLQSTQSVYTSSENYSLFIKRAPPSL